MLKFKADDTPAWHVSFGYLAYSLEVGRISSRHFDQTWSVWACSKDSKDGPPFHLFHTQFGDMPEDLPGESEKNTLTFVDPSSIHSKVVSGDLVLNPCYKLACKNAEDVKAIAKFCTTSLSDSPAYDFDHGMMMILAKHLSARM